MIRRCVLGKETLVAPAVLYSEAMDQELPYPVQNLVTMGVHEKDIQLFAALKGPWAMSI